MLRLLGAVLLCATFSIQPAVAADLPTSTAAATRYIWSGPYVGLNAGYGRSHMEALGAGSTNVDGFAGGGQIGINWQNGSAVIGVEADFQGSTARASNNLTPVITFTDKIPYFATTRARLGVATGDLLIFATGGAAYVNGEFTIATGAISSTTSVNRLTWTAGGGAEWMVAPQWSAKIEYLYIDTGRMNLTLPTFVPGGYATEGHATIHLARAGVNFHF